MPRTAESYFALRILDPTSVVVLTGPSMAHISVYADTSRYGNMGECCDIETSS